MTPTLLDLRLMLTRQPVKALFLGYNFDRVRRRIGPVH